MTERHLWASMLYAICVSQLALADDTPTYRMQRQADGSRHLVLANGNSDPTPASGDRSYDNWRGPSFSPPGVSRYRSSLTFGGNEFGDDLMLNSWQPSIVNDLGFTIYNSSSTGTMTVYWLRIRFYDADLNLLGTDEASYSGAILAPGGGAKVYSDDGFFAGYSYQTQESMYISMEFFRATGVNASDLGALNYGPITFGNSSQYIRNMTTGHLIDLGAEPQTNMGFFIDTIAVPSPSSAALLATSSLLALRRRR